MKNIYDFPLDELEVQMLALDQKKYRATQLYEWLYNKSASDFESMSDISFKFRETLEKEYILELPKIVEKQLSQDGTIKLLLELSDGAKVECVLMPYDYGNVVCVTSQVGCNMGCRFCASGLLKKQRDLETHEMISQLLVMQSQMEKDERISHVVVMGIGEPFDNYDRVMRFIRIINHPKSFAIGARHITVSTCGLVEGIRRYANENIQINLAISLHAPNDEIRSKIMPINKAFPLKELMAALKEYQDKTNRRITFEYIMLRGVNDQVEHAKELSQLIKHLNAYVNLIPYNEVMELPFKKTPRDAIRKFVTELKRNNVNVTVRKEFGQDIDAACGQLRAKTEGQ